MKLGQWLLGRGEEHSGIICGLDACGKTTLLYRWKLGETVTTIPTAGFNIETIPRGKGWNFTLWDLGGSDRTRPFIRHYLAQDRFIIFVHDCVDQLRLDEQLGAFHSCAKKMLEVGARYMWVIFNKQDDLPPNERDSTVRGLMSRYEKAAARYSDSVVVRVLHLPGLSAKEGTQIHVVLDDIKQTLQDSQKPTAKSQVELKGLQSAHAPSRWKLVEQAEEMVNADGTTVEEFWRLFESGQLPAWDLYNLLKAGYFIMIDGFRVGSSIFNSAEVFIAHLERLRGIDPDRFPIATHRTMAVFWLVQLQIAALNCRGGGSEGKLLSRDDFKDVLVHSPELMDAGLWKDYYSKDRLFTPEAREGWCAPDLRPFPSVIRSHTPYTRPHARPVQSESDRLVGFALVVVQKSIRSKLTRGAVVRQALGALQSSTIRQRASQTSLPPYSETKAYFWIQLTHAALEFLEAKRPREQKSMTGRNGSVQALTPSAFKALFGITGEEWRKHYSQSLWDSVGARMVFADPDLKPLPATIAVPAFANVQIARSKLADGLGLLDSGHKELPLTEDLALMAEVVIDEAELVDLEGPDGPIIRRDSHARRLLRLYRELFRDATGRIANEDDALEQSAQALGMSAALDCELPGFCISGLAQRAFWIQQVGVAMNESSSASTFEELISLNPHLAYEQLPLVYFSSTLGASSEARDDGVRPLIAMTSTREQIQRDAQLIYSYHHMGMSLGPADAIFCLCSLDTRVAERAAQLWLDSHAPHLIYSGGSGKLTAGRFTKPEAEVFADVARRMGVPAERIVIEPAATNTGENVRFTHALLEARGMRPASLILVQKPYMERRTYATFKKQWPDPHTAFTVTSPRFDGFEAYPDAENPRDLVISIMVGDLVRIRDYPAKGFQVEQPIPREVWAAMERLVAAGFDKHLPEGVLLQN
ncbi:Uncharacterized protein TOPH_03659 [Tolypocladium ophioglossoides CBS 100239]|uniref:DUF218 domain-containing protein n=1 Tax=Tolypocladium ophioglossoides (strain CBS 100239) TaxID=1163406 RepID=A0A0L0NBZ0_TOLOC|nr:Uncharacterized protein TOPH_03659 [Tolypocladium ophioglossoides CBS 100239]